MAMNFGKPVIATAVGSNADIIRNNKTGILVPPDDPAAMAEAIQSVIDDREFGRALGIAAREYVTRDLSWTGIAEKTLGVYTAEKTAKNFRAK
jgi:glycosyltransferase involved in cell wall biosynthesis